MGIGYDNDTEALEETEGTENVNYDEISIESFGNVYSEDSITSVIDSKGNLFVCGHNSHGQLGETISEQKSSYNELYAWGKKSCWSIGDWKHRIYNRKIESYR